MTTLTAPPATSAPASSLTSGRLPRWAPWALLGFSLLISFTVIGVASVGQDLADFNIVGAVFFGVVPQAVLWSVARRATAV